MPEESNTLALTGLLFGGLTLIILFMPFVMYAKELLEQKREQKKTIIEILLMVFFLQFALAGMIVFLTSIIDTVIIKPDMKPSYGIQYFYGKIYSPIKWSGKTPIFWENWLAKDEIKNKNIVFGGEVTDPSNSLIAWYKILALIVFAAFSAIPLLILIIFFIVSFRQHQYEQHLIQHENGILVKITKGFSVYFGLVFMLYLHFLIASTATTIMGKMSGTFSYYHIMSSLWHSIIFG